MTNPISRKIIPLGHSKPVELLPNFFCVVGGQIIRSAFWGQNGTTRVLLETALGTQCYLSIALIICTISVCGEHAPLVIRALDTARH